MAGRGRGKGRGFTFDIGSIGFGKGGEALPASILQPPPLYPPLEKKPLPLRKTEADEAMLSLKEEIKYMLSTSPYYVKPEFINKDIERYSDRYKEKPQDELKINWKPDWNFIPPELKIRIKQPKSGKTGKPNIRNKKKSLETSAVDLEKLEELAEKEGATNKQTQENKTAEESKGDGGSDEEDVDEEEEYDEEDQEEENDYLVSHFDDDDDLAEDDDMDEGPIY